MCLRRLGNKTKLLPTLLPLFPEPITLFIDAFMGSGAVTFAMRERCQYVISNDNDADVSNLFLVVKEQPDALLDAVEQMPVHETLFKHWKTHQERDPIWQAARFLMLSNFGYMGKMNTLHFAKENNKRILLDNIRAMFRQVSTIQFMNCDFRDVIDKILFRVERDKDSAFLYCDPPYLGTGHNYQDGFTETDTRDLFAVCVNSGLRFAISEFAHPVVLELVNQYGLHLTEIGERRTLGNRQTEILVTNYETTREQLPLFV